MMGREGARFIFRALLALCFPFEGGDFVLFVIDSIRGAHTIAGGLKWEQGAEPPPPSPLTLTTGLPSSPPLPSIPFPHPSPSPPAAKRSP